MDNVDRVVCWFSCGATSAVATKLALEKYRDTLPVVIAYCDTRSEHFDNYRFIRDCEKWYEQEILMLHNPKYFDIWDVYSKTKYIAGIYGARCTIELKKKVRQKFENLDKDLQIFGYDFDENKRINRFKQNNPEMNVEFILYDLGIVKSDCMIKIMKAGIDIPMMYKLGYKNNNCIGCAKGAKGYWNKIRVDFPEAFEKMARTEEILGAKLNIITKNGKTKHISLRELPKNVGIYKSELPISCDIVCG
jgi:hypothetical protein